MTRRAAALSTSVIALVWLVYRCYAYGLYWPHLDPNKYFGPWYLPVPMVREKFLRAIYYLRGEPPIPQLLLGLLIKMFPWPFALPYASFLLSLLTLGSALAMRVALSACGFGVVLPTAVGVLFVLSPAPLALEMDGVSSAFHEATTSFVFAVSVAFLLRRRKWAFAATVCALIMTRATLSYFAVAGLVIGLALRSRTAVTIFGIALVVQLAWMTKNVVAFGEIVFETSSFSGYNLINGVKASGLFDEYLEVSRRRVPDAYDVIQCYSSGDFGSDAVAACMPEAAARDAELSAALGCEEVGVSRQCYLINSYVGRKTSAAFRKAYLAYLAENPEVLLRVVARSYGMFWGDIHTGYAFFRELVPKVGLWTVRRPVRWLKTVNIVALHSIVMLLFAVLLLRRLRGRRFGVVEAGLVYAFGAFLYVAAVSSVGDCGENNRFRFAVEPLIWLLPFLTWRCGCGWWLERSRGQAGSSPAPQTGAGWRSRTRAGSMRLRRTKRLANEATA